MPVCRHQFLECLKLHGGSLFSYIDIPNCPAALRVLELTHIEVSKAWLQGMSESLPCLEELTLEDCFDMDEADEEDEEEAGEDLITPSRTLK